MPASNVARYYFAFQATKGTPAAAPQYSIDVTSADLSPTVETETRAETGLGRDVGDTYIRLLTAGGNVTTNLRAMTAGALFYGVLGAKAVVGASAPYTHTLTVANDQPWMTWWRMVGDAIYERFDDCKITSLNTEWAAGGDVSAALGVTGLNFAKLTGSIPVGATHDSGPVLRVPGVVYTVDSVVDNTLTQGNVNIEAGQTAIQTVNVYPDYLEPGQRTIEVSWEQVFANATRYNDFLYSGSTPRQTVREMPVKFEFLDPATPAQKALTLEIPRVGMSPSSVNPDPGGDPLRLPVAGQAYRPVSGSIATAIVKNAVATYPAV